MRIYCGRFTSAVLFLERLAIAAEAGKVEIMAKQLFNSSESSNFILNMTEEKYSNIASKALMAMCLLVPLFTIPAECSDSVGFAFVSAGLAVAGVICMILALIAIIKKFISGKMILPVCAFAAMLVWGAISLFDSYSVKIGFYGFDGRGEGLLAIIFYFCFFITGLSLKTEKAADSLFNGILASGVLNSIWSMIQIFTGKLGSYKFVTVSIQPNAASGLSHSPIFLAMLLSLALTTAIIGAVMGESKKRRIICIVCACLFSFVMMFTYTLMGICGTILAVIAAVISTFISKAPKIRLASILSAIAPAVCAVILAQAGLIGDGSGYNLYDGRIMWWDSYNRISASGIYDNDKVDISDTADTYSYIFGETIDLIKEYPLTGSGPDQLIYPQIYSSAVIDENIGTFDRCYNEYLYTAATRGIPSLIALLAVIIPLIITSFKSMTANNNSRRCVTSFFMLLCGSLLFLIGCSSIAFSPVFWAAAGLSCASIASGKVAAISKKHEKTYGKSK